MELKIEFTQEEILSWLSEEERNNFLSLSPEPPTRSYTGVIDLLDSRITWTGAPQGYEYWFDIAHRTEYVDHTEFNGDRVKNTRLCILSEHSERSGELELKQDARYCIETKEWFIPDEVEPLLDSYGEFSGDYISTYEVEGCNDYMFYENGYIHTDNCVYGYISRHEEGYMPRNLDSLIYDEDNDEYFVNSMVASGRDVCYSERLDRYAHIEHEDFFYHEDEDDDDLSVYNSGYHSLSRRWACNVDTKFTVGFEIEKEDYDVARAHKWSPLYDKTQWCKERDGSLNDDDGYELISPVYDLNSNKLELDIAEHEELVELINADYNTSSCGGHINLGSSLYKPEELFEGLSQFFPLLYAMYPYRISKTYSAAKKKHEYYRKEKYSAIYMRDNVLEFRIFSGVKNVQQLIWRRDLIRIFVENINKSESDVLRLLLNHRSKLYKHLRKVYSQEQIIDKTEAFINHVREWNNIKLPLPNIKKMKDNLPKGLEDNEAA